MENILQKVRKKNLRHLIDRLSGGSVDVFAKEIGKHRTYVYAMLKDMNDKNPRTITSKMARYIENIYNLESTALDSDNFEQFLPTLRREDWPEEYQGGEFDAAVDIGGVERHKVFEVVIEYKNDRYDINVFHKRYIDMGEKEIPASINNHPVYYVRILDDLMAPRFDKEDIVFIEYFDNFKSNEIHNGSVYVVGVNNSVNIVRIFRDFNNLIRIKVDNPNKQMFFPERTISEMDFNQYFKVFGRVVGGITLYHE